MGDEVHSFEDLYISRQREVIHTYPSNFCSEVPLVIDNGSFRCRAGWANEPLPKLNFRNLVTRQRNKKDIETQVGNNIANLEAVRWLLRTQFDRDIVTNFDIQEQIFDHIFHHLGIRSEGRVEHPVVVTEPLCNLNYSRNLMSELLFECYQVPRVAYGVDALFSSYHHSPSVPPDGLVVSFGYHNTCVIPYLNGRLDASRCRRVNIGGFQQVSHLLRALQLKYPGHIAAVNVSRVEEILSKYSYIATDFQSELEAWSDSGYHQKHVCRLQLPFTPVHSWSDDSKQANSKKLSRDLEEVATMWSKHERSLIANFVEQWQEFQSEVSLAFQALFKTLNKCNKLADECVDQLQHGVALIKTRPDTGALHHWLEGLRACHHGLCENRSDWLNQKEVLKQKFLVQETEDGEDKEDGQDGGIEDLSEQETKRKLLLALEMMEEKMRPEEEESRKLSSLEELLRNIEAVMNSHSNQKQLTFDLAEYYQLHIGAERVRVPEILFQPSILGSDQGGVSETIEFILTQYGAETGSRLVRNVFLTGAAACYPNMVDRIEADLRIMRPFQSTFKVTRADDPVLDAWKGAAMWSSDKARFTEGSITRSDYLEKGGEYLKEHLASNIFYPTTQR